MSFSQRRSKFLPKERKRALRKRGGSSKQPPALLLSPLPPVRKLPTPFFIFFSRAGVEFTPEIGAKPGDLRTFRVLAPSNPTAFRPAPSHSDASAGGFRYRRALPRQPPVPKTPAGHPKKKKPQTPHQGHGKGPGSGWGVGGRLPNFTCLSHQPLGGRRGGTQPVAVGLLPGHALPGKAAAQAPGKELNPSARVPAHPSPPPAPHFGRRFGPGVSVPFSASGRR